MPLNASADSWQLFSGKQIQKLRRAKRGSKQYARLAAPGNHSDPACSGAQWVTPHRSEHAIGVHLVDDGNESALAGDVQGLEAQYLAGGADAVAHRHRLPEG